VQKLSVFASNMATNAAGVAAAMVTVSTSAAEVTALANLLTILANRKDLLFPALAISATAKNQIQPE